MIPFQIPSYPFKINYEDKIMLAGSCFSEEIGNNLSSLKFNILQNPNGILYDPLSITMSLEQYVSHEPFDAKELFLLNGLWHSWKHHSSYSGIDKMLVAEKINTSITNAHSFLTNAKFLVITFGTAFYYQLTETQQNVANCHKAPSGIFHKKLLTVNEIIDATSNCLSKLHQVNPGLTIIFTISPVKHTRDGVIENNLGKARLIDAVHSLVSEKEHTFYFPSYELVTDVLRDYRFYKNDMVHPSEQAIQFVLEKFCEALLDNKSIDIMKKIREIITAVNHRPFYYKSVEHQQFMASQVKKILQLKSDFPFLDLSEELSHFDLPQ